MLRAWKFRTPSQCVVLFGVFNRSSNENVVGSVLKSQYRRLSGFVAVIGVLTPQRVEPFASFVVDSPTLTNDASVHHSFQSKSCVRRAPISFIRRRADSGAYTQVSCRRQRRSG